MPADLNAATYLQNGNRQAIGVVTLDSSGNTRGDSNPAPVKAGDPGSVSATIANAGSLSPAVAVHGALVGIIMPAAWTAANLTFQAGMTSGGPFYDVYDDGTERAILSANIVTGRMVALNLGLWLPVNYIKLRSGTSAVPVPQGADRVFTLVYAQ